MLDNLQGFWAVGPILATSFEPLSRYRNVASLGLSIAITLVDFQLNWLTWFRFLILVGGSLVILIDCMIFLSPFLEVIRMSISTVFFLPQLNSKFSSYKKLSSDL